MTPVDLDAIVEMLDDGGTVCQCGADIARWECECGEMTCNDCGSPYAHGGPHYEHSRTELPRFGKEHGRALAAALREAWQERDSLNDARNVLTDAVATLTQERDAARVASTPNEREAMLRAALDNREAYARDLAALVTHSDQRIAELAQERDAAVATVRALNADIAAAAGELRVPIPTPGSDAARMLRANVILRQERDEARAERRAARLDRDAAEERVAELQRLAGGQR